MKANVLKLREKYEALMAMPEYAGIEFIRLRSPKQTRRWLDEEFTGYH